MPKGPKIKTEALQVISTVVSQNPDRRRDQVVAQIGKELEFRGQRVPERNTLLRLISTYRHRSPVSLDVPWSLGSLVQHPIPSEALRVVLQAQVLFELWKSPHSPPSKKGLTGAMIIREAMWVSRLHPLFINTNEVGGSTMTDWERLVDWVREYSSQERDWESGKKKTHLYTSDTDKRLMDDIGIEHRRFNSSRLLFPIGGKGR